MPCSWLPPPPPSSSLCLTSIREPSNPMSCNRLDRSTPNHTTSARETTTGGTGTSIPLAYWKGNQRIPVASVSEALLVSESVSEAMPWARNYRKTMKLWKIRRFSDSLVSTYIYIYIYVLYICTYIYIYNSREPKQFHHLCSMILSRKVSLSLSPSLFLFPGPKRLLTN